MCTKIAMEQGNEKIPGSVFLYIRNCTGNDQLQK